MSGVNWAKLMQEQQLKDQQMMPNVKLPPKTIPMRPAPPPPTSGLADMKLQDQPSPPRPTHKTNLITPALPVKYNYSYNAALETDFSCRELMPYRPEIQTAAQFLLVNLQKI